ncbi:transposase [Chloroflexota bacterium]
MTAPLRVRELEPNELEELRGLYDKTRDVRLRTRAQIILLSVEQGMTAPQIGSIVRINEQSVRRWMRRFNAEGINGLADRPRSGAPGKVTAAYREKLLSVVRQRPRTLGQDYSLWSLERLADYMAEEIGIRVSIDTVRRVLKAGGIVLSRPQHTISSPDPEYKVKKRRLKTGETT